MFCDDVLEWFTVKSMMDKRNLKGPQLHMDTPSYVATARSYLMGADHIVLQDSAIRAIDALANPRLVEQQRDLLVLPSRSTWLEWHGKSNGVSAGTKRHGMLFHHAIDEGPTPDEESEELVRTATVLRFSELIVDGRDAIHMLSMTFDTRRTGETILRRQSAAIRRMMAGQTDPYAASWSTVDLPKASAWLGACLAILATPRVYTNVIDDRTKLNKKRVRNGKPEFVPYRKVFVDIGKEYERRPYEPREIGEEGSILGKRARHQVRPFLRLKMGKVEIVKPHWRGDPSLGTVRHNYVVR